MEEIVKTIRALPGLISLKAATQEDVADAEAQLGLSFTKEYKEYLTAYGAVLAQELELTGISKAEHRSVVAVTKREWNLNSSVPHTMYVVENTSVDGIVIWQDTSGAIYQTRPNMPPKKIAVSLSAYIKGEPDNAYNLGPEDGQRIAELKKLK